MFYALHAFFARPVDDSAAFPWSQPGRARDTNTTGGQADGRPAPPSAVVSPAPAIKTVFAPKASSIEFAWATWLLLGIAGSLPSTTGLAEQPKPAVHPSSTFPTPEDTEPLAAAHPQLSPTASASTIRLPAGFEATVVAAEPDVCNPIGMAWDHLGRLWVAENYTYAKPDVRFRTDLRDRVIVFAGENSDGSAANRTVFMDTLSKLSSVEVGPGLSARGDSQTVNGVWLMCPPQLLFVPDADRDLVPDAAPRVVLDGFDVAEQNYHNFANGLRFGPDGWLYGRCGGSCPGRVGTPGSPEEQRTALEGGVWRFNIHTERFEVLCHGTTNPWGHDFNEFGDLFFINTVNGHLWHGIAGAHFNRPFTLDPNPSVYATIDQHADHYHFDTGQSWRESRDGAANDFGGGHAHSGLMIYQESTWPASYRGALMTLNFHGRRANRENLVRRGSGYIGTHGDDFFLSGDEWFRGIEMSAGPTGNVLVLDWSDLGECHEQTGVHRSSGRIYRISWQPDDPQQQITASLASDSRKRKMQLLQSADAAQLLELILGNDRWYSHQATMRLHELKNNGENLTQVIETMRDLATQSFAEQEANDRDLQDVDPATRCRLLWSLDRIGGLSESASGPTPDELEPWLRDPSEHVRAAAIRVLTQHWPIDDVYGPTANSRAAWPELTEQAQAFVAMFEHVGAHDSALLRLALASTLQRLPESLRADAAIKLLQICGEQDIDDHNIPKLIWYGVMSRAASQPREMVDLAAVSQLPELTTYLARSIAEQVESQPQPLAELIAITAAKFHQPEPPAQLRGHVAAVMTGIVQGVTGIRHAEMPARWPELRDQLLQSDSAWRPQLEQLDTLFGSGRSTAQLTELLANPDADPTERLAALKGLVAAWHDDQRTAEPQGAEAAGKLIAAAGPLLADPRVNLAAAESLATLDHPAVAQALADNYGRFRSALRPKVISLLCSRATFANVLIERIENARMSKEVLTASHIRDILALGQQELNARVETVWGRIRQTPQDRVSDMARLKTLLSDERIAAADLAAGRVLFDQTCASCHKMFGAGHQVGPDLTGSQRTDLDYLIHNIVDPDAVVGVDYRATKILTVDGRLLVGLVTARTRRTLTIAAATRTETIARDDIEAEQPTPNSPMPSGLLQPLSPDQIVNLIAYLQSPVQVAAQQPEP